MAASHQPKRAQVPAVLISIPRTAEERSGGGEEAQIMLQVEVFKEHQGLSVEFVVRTIPL